jgi:molybdopterin-guanine dinucleotide biosynthesis protein A
MVEQHGYDAIVLAGGRSSRAGTAKLALQRDGRSLLSYAVAAVAEADAVIAVGEPPTGDQGGGVVWRREDPPYAGPVAAIGAALDEVTSEVVVVLAGDLPGAAPAVPALLAALEVGFDAAVLVDEAAVRQPLLAAYRTAWLRARVPAASAAARSLLDGARVIEVPDRWGAGRDLDTADDALDLGFAPPDG